MSAKNKFCIEFARIVVKRLVIRADDRDEALKLARERAKVANTDYQFSSCVELLPDGDFVDDHILVGACECCDKILWDGMNYVTNDDGENFCRACQEAYEKSQEGKGAP